MENDEKAPEEPTVGEPVVPPRKPSSNTKWYAVIIALVIIIAALAVLVVTGPSFVGTATSTSVSAAPSSAIINEPYNLSLKTNGKFTSMNVYWGDGTNQTVYYGGSTTVDLAHTYTTQGNFLIYYVVNAGSSSYTNAQSLIQVTAAYSGANATAGQYLAQYVSYGTLELNAATSSSPLINNTYIFAPGNTADFNVSYSTPGINQNYNVIGQTVELYLNGSLVNTAQVPYVFDPSQAAYLATSNYFNVSKLKPGYYEVKVITTTANYNPTNKYSETPTVTNTTLVTYNGSVANRTATYQWGTYVTPYTLTYLEGTSLNNYGTTQVMYSSAANVTYNNNGASFNYANGTTVSYLQGANVTFNANTNVTFDVNATGMYSPAGTGWTSVQYVKDTNYTFLSGSMVNFTTMANMTVHNNTGLSYAAQSTVLYAAGTNFTYAGTTTANVSLTYNANVTLSYTGSSTTVYYPVKTNVTVTKIVKGSTSIKVPTGQVNPNLGVYHTSQYFDLPVVSSAKIYVPSAGTPSTFVNAEIVAGGYTTLDPAIEYFTVDGEVLINTLQTLVFYNGSSSSSFIPELASALPSIANGTINNNYHNYTVTYTNQAGKTVTYPVNITPYENYTFHIRSTAKWQNGQSVSAWDVYYSFVRTLLFDAGSPLTPGWIQAQYMLPNFQLPDGTPAYYVDNTFYNITQNMTVNNATNNITFHFNTPMDPSLVYQIFSAAGASVLNANWSVEHGSSAAPALSWKGGANTLPWNSTGFQEYQAQANIANYNTYLQNHVLSDGPYQILLNQPGNQIVLVKNPNFVSPSQYYPAASIDRVVIEYLSQPSTQFLQLKTGYAQAVAAQPTSFWNATKTLIPNLVHPIQSFPTLSIYWYTFNANINTTLMKQDMTSKANAPQELFINNNARKAFAYAFPYQEFLNSYLGNKIYGANFGALYAGMLPPGMAFAQDIAALNSTTNGVPYMNLALAKQYWNAFVNSTMGQDIGISWSSSQHAFVYDGQPLYIPVGIPIGDPTDTLAVQQWGTNIGQVINGATMVSVPATYTAIYGTWLAPNANPSPITWSGWAPDYPYPTDYLGPMGLPSNSSTYPGPYSMTQYWFSHAPIPNPSEAANFTAMLNEYHNATLNPAIAKQEFQSMNNMLVNETFYVYTYQLNAQVILSANLNWNLVPMTYNPMTGGSGIMQYNFMAYNTTS